MSKVRSYLLFSIILVLLGFVNEIFFKRSGLTNKDADYFQSNLNKDIVELHSIISNENFICDFEHNGIELSKGQQVFVYQSDTLKYWSSNQFRFNKSELENLNDTIAFLGNSWHYIINKKDGECHIIATLLLKYEYPYQNNFLKNKFLRKYSFPPGVTIENKYKSDYIPVNVDNKTVLYLNFENAVKRVEAKKMLSLACYLIALFTFFYAIFLLVIERQKSNNRVYMVSFSVLGLLLFRFIIQYLKLPGIWYELELFQPELYAHSSVLPSLGDFLVSSALLLLIVLIVNRLFYSSDSKKDRVLIILILLVIQIFISGLLYFSIHTLVYNSNLSFEAFQVKGLSLYSFVGYLILFLQGASLFLITLKFFQFLNRLNRGYLYTVPLIIAIVFFTFWYHISVVGVLLLIVWFTLIYLAVRRSFNMFEFSTVSVLLFLLTIIINENLISKQLKKEQKAKELIANNIAYEHDPVAELLFEEMSGKISGDSILTEQIFDYSITVEDILSYIKKAYFTGYWNKYDLQITLCNEYDSLMVKDWVPCNTFFTDIISSNGLAIPGTKFTYIDDLNGRVSYLGVFNYRQIDMDYTLYIELNSKLLNQVVGYPELLLDQSKAKKSVLENYSYAKYYKGNLITQNGTYPYKLSIHPNDYKNTYTYYQQGGYNHLLYKFDDENIVKVSRVAPTFFDYIISFSYLFVFYYILLSVLFLFHKRFNIQRNISQSFYQRIQLSVLLILVISLVFIGGGSIYFVIKQYKNKHVEIIEEKIQSVFIELDHKLAMLDELDESWYSSKYGTLDQLLIKFSDVFYSDINLYYPDGRLMAASRREVFDLGLTGAYMNPEAYKKMAIEQQARYLHQESIGNMKYLSAYIPFTNYENKLLAYLNLPYFVKQDDLRNEVSNLIVTLLNVYVLLILLTIGAAIFISRQITQPLTIIGKKLQEVDLKGKNEPLVYHSDDEIGQLVHEYNKMISELHRSADLLAQSERETAWREMAKQIAHEIKNPLTPMKLNLQHMQRTWKDKQDNLDEYITQVSNSLIEQIDNLSDIATAFSNFAKMPKAKPDKVDLVWVLRNIFSLFQAEANVDISFNCNLEKAVVKADKEQLIRAFNNIVKNAIQSVPKDKKGQVNLSLIKEKDSFVFKCTDNGKGITESVKDKLYLPSFTTKTSGMGLGLAITKNIIDGLNGEIWFDTEIGKGTTFYIKLKG